MSIAGCNENYIFNSERDGVFLYEYENCRRDSLKINNGLKQNYNKQYLSVIVSRYKFCLVNRYKDLHLSKDNFYFVCGSEAIKYADIIAYAISKEYYKDNSEVVNLLKEPNNVFVNYMKFGGGNIGSTITGDIQYNNVLKKVIINFANDTDYTLYNNCIMENNPMNIDCSSVYSDYCKNSDDPRCACIKSKDPCLDPECLNNETFKTNAILDKKCNVNLSTCVSKININADKAVDIKIQELQDCSGINMEPGIMKINYSNIIILMFIIIVLFIAILIVIFKNLKMNF